MSDLGVSTYSGWVDKEVLTSR